MAYLGKTPSQAVRSRYYFTATGGETSLSGADDNANTLTFTDGNYVDVALNGVTLVAGTDYNTTTTNTIGGLTALVASDVIEVIVYDTFSVFSGNVNGDFTVGGTLTAANITNTGNLNFGDNDKAIFGAGSDLQIYHDGGSSWVSDVGAGNLKISSDGAGVFLQKGATEFMGEFLTDGAVRLYYDNAAKFETTATGVDVTGDATVDRVVNSGVATTASTPTYTWGGQQALTGMYLPLGNTIAFSTNATERMRIDSSGNLLVGTTTGGGTIGTYNGFGAFSGGTIFSSATSNRSVFARRSTDGSIIDFRKDGTTVGSIGTNSSALTVGTSDTGVVFFDSIDSIAPLNISTNSGRDAAINLGASFLRFKDLYLSGGVYLGGTGSANYLDDYEEGTWTPRLRGSTGEPGTLITGTGTYTKIGRLVTVTFEFSNINTTGYTGTLSVDQLTFSPSASYMAGGGAMFNLIATFPSGTGNVCNYVVQSSSSILFYASETQAGWTALTHNAGPVRYLLGSFTYKAT